MNDLMPKFTTLNNGAKVLHQHGAYVLCKWDHWSNPNKERQYVTWKIHGDGSSYAGHYFDTIEKAVNEYEQRAGVELTDPTTAYELVKLLVVELKALTDGEDCDHDAGICWCGTKDTIRIATDFLVAEKMQHSL